MRKILVVVLVVVSLFVSILPSCIHVGNAYDLCNIKDTLRVLPVEVSFNEINGGGDESSVDKVTGACRWWERSSDGTLDFHVYDTVCLTISEGEYVNNSELIPLIPNYAYYDLIIITYMNGNMLKKNGCLGYSSSFGVFCSNINDTRAKSVDFCVINPNQSLNVYIHEMGHSIGFHNELYHFIQEPDWMMEDYPSWVKKEIFGWDVEVNVIGKQGNSRMIRDGKSIWLVDLRDGTIRSLKRYITNVTTARDVMRQSIGLVDKNLMYDINLDEDITMSDARKCLRMAINVE